MNVFFRESPLFEKTKSSGNELSSMDPIASYSHTRQSQEKTAQKHFLGSILRFRKRASGAADRTPAAATPGLVSDQLYSGGVSRDAGALRRPERAGTAERCISSTRWGYATVWRSEMSGTPSGWSS